ncbi:hypothetical protein ETD83_12745 [Actinomadura soli]|uniref:Peptidase M48 domain-containing protein n=1 Tax=Actinomadura soli TaxID=2508997 RepID=A0A5C4JEN1_9ACTN|nr:M48 family metalloprotease [Actinomadura soli]TMR02405.1 hypothetical protein ETD83_12745 [Actinomadura soli]
MSGATETLAPRSASESTPSTSVGPDPSALPAGTTLRFLMLVVVMVVAMVEMSIGILRPSQDLGLLCKFAAGFDPGGKLIDEFVREQAQAEALRACTEGAEGAPRWYGLAWAGTVLLAAGGLYLLLPRWKRSRRGVEPLRGQDPQDEVRAEVVRLAGRAGVRSLPDLVVDRLALDPGAVVYGRAGRRTLCLNNGLLHTRRVDSARFEAVVLHELAHLRHRDVDIAYAVTALWRVFLALVVVPYTLLMGKSLVDAQFFGEFPGSRFPGADEVLWPVTRTFMIKDIAIVAFLFLLVVLARADTLRHRELYADRGAVALGADPAVWQVQAEGRMQGRSATRAVTALWRSHPSWAKRWRSLRNPAGLFTLTDVPLFLLGVVTLVTGNALSTVWDRGAAAWVVGTLAACVLTVAVWRAVLYAIHSQAFGPRGIRAGLALGLGLICGVLLSGLDPLSGWWPEHGEPLLFLLLGSVVYVTWLAQCARLHLRAAPSGHAVPRWAVLVAAVAGSVVAAAGLYWWLYQGQLWMMGDILAALDARRSFSGPWDSRPQYESVLPWISSVLITLVTAGSSPTIAAGAVVLWAYPALLLLRRPRAAGLRSTVLTGLAGGLVGVAAVAAVMAYVHSWHPPLEEQTSPFVAVYRWWRTVALWTGVVVTAAVVAATTRTHRLPRALTAAAIAHVAMLAGQFVLQAADGCVGPLQVMANTCHWLPGTSWTLTKALAYPVTPAFFGAALAATAMAQLPRVKRKSVPSDAVRRSWPARTVVAAAAVTGIVLTAVVTDPIAPISGDDSPPATVPARPEPADTDEKVRDLQLLAWYTLGGHADMVALTDRYAELAEGLFQELNAKKATLDGDTLRPLCDGLARDTATARRHLRVPDLGLDRKWSTLLDRGRDAAAECMAVLDGSGDDVERNAKMLERLGAALEQTQVALPPLTDRVSAALARWPEWKAG